MKREELEKKLKISKNTCIHCPTIKLAIQMSNIFHQLGLKWCNEKHYIRNTNWDKHKENTLYYPFDGLYSSLKFADLTGYKVINAKEFIALQHTEGKEFDLENYTPKGELEGFPKEIIVRMLDCQEEQGSPRDISVFERDRTAGQYVEGFARYKTKEGNRFWYEVINNKDFNLFFNKYPKQDYQFKVGDEVIDIILGQKGKIYQISTNDNSTFPIYVSFNKEKKTYTLDGRCFIDDKYPRLLHYRNDYDYDVIDFNNLPERQEDKRWRAEEGKTYYFFTSNFEVEKYYDHNDYNDNKAYNSGNYFRTEAEAKIIAQKLNTYFKQLITKLI